MSKPIRILVAGAGGFAREVAWLIDEINRRSPTYEFVGFFVSDLAMLQIGQLGRDSDYEEVRQEFFELLESWLDLSLFPLIDVRRAISNLHRRIENGDREETG